MSDYYQSDERGFQLFRSRERPAWREPQFAALGAVVAQWSLSGSEAPLVSVPTGVGKTAIALAAPFLARAKRTLLVVPTQELRRQTVEQFRTQSVLLRIGALDENGFEFRNAATFDRDFSEEGNLNRLTRRDADGKRIWFAGVVKVPDRDLQQISCDQRGRLGIGFDRLDVKPGGHFDRLAEPVCQRRQGR